MPQLPDGTIVPSYMGAGSSSAIGLDPAGRFDNVAIRVGEVIAIYYPGDKENQSKDQVEYNVQVHYRDGAGSITRIPYRCTVADGFGATGDYIQFSLRTSSGKKADQNVTDGSRVLIACPNGDTAQATILACLHNPSSPDHPARLRGNSGEEGNDFFAFSFNGVEMDINDSGEATFKVKGPTGVDGQLDDKRSDDEQKGSYVSFKQDGRIIVSDNRGDEDESIVISPADRTITVKAETHDTSTEKNWTVRADGDASIEAAGNANVAGDKVFIGSTEASENLVLGQKLVSALGAFVDIMIQNAPNFSYPGFPGIPVPISPGVVAQLISWKLQWVQGFGVEPAQILSTDKFTER